MNKIKQQHNPIWDFLTATREPGAFRLIRDEHPNFNLAAVDGVDDVQRLIWEMRVLLDGAEAQPNANNKSLDEIIAGKLEGQESKTPNAACAWLLNSNEQYSPTKSAQFARDFIARHPPKIERDWQAAQPLAQTLASVPKLAPEMLPEPLRDWIADSSECIGAAPEYMAVAALIGLASLVGRKVRIRPRAHGDWSVTCNLFGMIVGRPGVKKSPAMEAGLSPLNKLSALAMSSHEAEISEFEVSRAVDEATSKGAKTRLEQAAKKATANRSELEELARLSQAASDATAPTLKRYIINDASIEATGERLRENPNGLLTARDELTGFLRGLERQGHEQDQAFYLEAWNGNGITFTYDRIGRGTITIPGPCVSLLGTIQPGPLSRYIRNVSGDDRQRDGFISRFQMLVYPDPIPYKRVDRRPDHDARDRAFRVFKELDNLTPEASGAQLDNYGEVYFLRFDSEAQGIFDQWIDALEMRLQIGQMSGLMEEHLSKFRSLFPSIALVFHLVSVADGSAKPGPVSGHAAVSAGQWCSFLEMHARRIYQAAFDGDTETAQMLAERLDRLPEPFTAREIQQKNWQGLKTGDEIAAALNLLEGAEWIASEDVQAGSAGGRPSTRYWKNPTLKMGVK